MVPIFRRFALLLLLLPVPLRRPLAQGFENLEMLDSRVAAALGANIGEPGGADARRSTGASVSRPARSPSRSASRSIGARHRALRAARLAHPRVRSCRPRPPGGRRRRAGRRRAPQPIVRRGDQVELVAIAAGFTVSTLAIADQDGAPGDRIRVRTERRTAPVIGQVLADGRVALPGFN